MLERHWRRPFGRHSPQLGPTALLFLLHWASQALSCISSAPRQVAYGGARSPFPYGYSGGAGGGGGGPARPTIIVNGPGAVAGQARAAPNLPLNPIGTNGQLTGQSANALLGNRVAVAEFSSDGFNAQGGGPVPNGASLNCNFEADSHQCCWANVPTPSDDQIDWQLVQGRPDSQQFRNISMDSRYLVAYASGAAPSDEAQLSSCAVACASSPIRVRARHWQSYNVLLQVCQRESFPPSLGFNPLLNCQEFPSSSQVAHTELVLPKASFVDIIFVASNFIDERGDIVFLDDIEVLYESHPPECGGTPAPSSSGAQKSSKGKEPMKPAKSAAKNNGNRIGEEEEEENGIRRTKLGGGSSNGAIGGGSEGASNRGGVIRGGGGEAIGRAAAAGAGSAGADLAAGTHGQLKSIQTTGIDAQTTGVAAGTGIRAEGAGEEAIGIGAVDGGGLSQSGGSGIISSNSKAHGVAGKSGDLASSSSKSSSSLAASIKKTFASSASKSTATTSSKSSSSAASSSSSSSSSASASSSAKKQQALISSSKACQSIRCSFEEGNSCAYLDTTESDSASAVRGLTTRFEVIKGQFMNRVTGVKEGTEGNFYAAVFLYPREKAGLWADIGGQLAEDTRLRFQYYEGTHGVQLKGCCARGEGGEGEGNGGGKDDGRAEAEEQLECPFQSDKFVSVSDRMWKWGSFVCPRGSRKVIFLCENTRTNQGACAMDDIAVVENRADINLQDKSIC